MRLLIPLFILILLSLFTSCSQFNKASDLLTNPTARERYQKDFNISGELFKIWENQVQVALNDSISINTPYLQAGNFFPRSFPILSYNLNLNIGEKLLVKVEADSLQSLVFIDLYYSQNDSIRSYKKLLTTGYGEGFLEREIEQPGIYKVIIQPEIGASTPFKITMRTYPVYRFPVVGSTNNSIQSFWGATRDGGKRSHEGIDIFASRGTPVIAVTDGRISSSGEKGLGGKQVWLRDLKRGQSLYYAHLDSIAPLRNRNVKAGDTLGFVGNTGNAKTTAPHLHFGIYKGYRGAVDPLPHVLQDESQEAKIPGNIPLSLSIVTNAKANLRDQPSGSKVSQIIGNSPAKDTLRVLGKALEWYHVRTQNNQAAFIHENLVTPL